MAQSNVPRKIEQDLATTGIPGWERGHSGMVRGRNEDLSGNRAKLFNLLGSGLSFVHSVDLSSV